MSHLPRQLRKTNVRTEQHGRFDVSMIEINGRTEIVAFGPRGEQIEMNTTNFDNVVIWLASVSPALLAEAIRTRLARPEAYQLTLAHAGVVAKAHLVE